MTELWLCCLTKIKYMNMRTELWFWTCIADDIKIFSLRKWEVIQLKYSDLEVVLPNKYKAVYKRSNKLIIAIRFCNYFWQLFQIPTGFKCYFYSQVWGNSWSRSNSRTKSNGIRNERVKTTTHVYSSLSSIIYLRITPEYYKCLINKQANTHTSLIPKFVQ